MSDAQRCEPPDPMKEGWYWVEGPYSTGPLNWRHFNGGFWELSGDQPDWTPERAHDVGCRYLAPVAPPDLVRALVEALELYAEPAHWSVDGTFAPNSPESAYRPDCGDTARSILHRAKEAGL
jgi:hypothetical protein